MDETIERKVRDLKLQILKAEKELAKTQSSANLGAWLHAGRANQIQKNAERDRQRLEAKLTELKAKLEETAPGSTTPPEKPKVAATKKTADKKPAAKTTTRKSARK
jgi:hypothetical protein